MELKSVLIIRVRTKWENCTAGVLFVIVTSMIRGRFGRNEVLLPINHKNCNFCEIKISLVIGEIVIGLFNLKL